MIEIIDFHRSNFSYKNEDLIPNLESALHSPNRARSSLMYRRIYQLFGPSYPGEFVKSTNKSGLGTYVLSYPGIAFSFPLQETAWSDKVDHATMLSTSASPVTSLAIFEGNSWPEGRKDLFIRKPSNPRSSQLASAQDEIDHVNVYGAGKVELLRRSGSPFWLVLSQTTPQDLITELGPPDQMFKRPAHEGTPPQKPVDAGGRNRGRRMSGLAVPSSYGSARSARSTPSSFSSNNTDTYATTDFEDDDDGDTMHRGEAEQQMQEEYYCYFSHGFDILLGPPTDISPVPGQEAVEEDPVPTSDSHKVVTRIVLHGNIPGSYPFNRHRRSRWSLISPPYPVPKKAVTTAITSESTFPQFHKQLIKAFDGIWPEKDMSEGMVIVRNWNGRDDDSDSPSNSAIWIGGQMDDIHTTMGGGGGTGIAAQRDTFGGQDDDDLEDDDWDAVDPIGDAPPRKGNGEDRWLRNTKLFKFPGLMFEVMENGSVSALTVY